MIKTQVINFIISAQTTAVEDRYRWLVSPFSFLVLAVREYRITRTKLDVCSMSNIKLKYFMKFEFPCCFMLANFILKNINLLLKTKYKIFYLLEDVSECKVYFLIKIIKKVFAKYTLKFNTNFSIYFMIFSFELNKKI